MPYAFEGAAEEDESRFRRSNSQDVPEAGRPAQPFRVGLPPFGRGKARGRRDPAVRKVRTDDNPSDLLRPGRAGGRAESGRNLRMEGSYLRRDDRILCILFGRLLRISFSEASPTREVDTSLPSESRYLRQDSLQEVRCRAARAPHEGSKARLEPLNSSTLRPYVSHFPRVDCRKMARWPPYAPFCSDGIGLSVLPGALRLLGLAPVGCRRLTSSRVNVLAGRFILDAGCVVSAPLPALSGPSACAGPPYLGRGDVPQQPRWVTVGRPRSPGRPRHPCGPIWT